MLHQWENMWSTKLQCTLNSLYHLKCILIERIRETNIQLKPDVFLLDLMDKQLGIVLYIITVARLLFAQRWKKWMLKLMELSEMAKLTTLNKRLRLTFFFYVETTFGYIYILLKNNTEYIEYKNDILSL